MNNDKLLNFLQIIEDKHIDVACVCESWFDAKSGVFSKTIKEHGYELYHAFRADKRGGGVAIMYKNQLSVKEGEKSTSKFSSFEYAYVTINLKSKQKVMIVTVSE